MRECNLLCFCSSPSRIAVPMNTVALFRCVLPQQKDTRAEEQAAQPPDKREFLIPKVFNLEFLKALEGRDRSGYVGEVLLKGAEDIDYHDRQMDCCQSGCRDGEQSLLGGSFWAHSGCEG